MGLSWAQILYEQVAVSTKSRILKVKSAARTGPTSTRAARTVCGISPPPLGTASDSPSSTLNWSPTRNAPMTTLRSLTAETSIATAWGGTVGASCHTPLRPVETRCTWYSTPMPQSRGKDFMQATRQVYELPNHEQIIWSHLSKIYDMNLVNKWRTTFKSISKSKISYFIFYLY